MWHEVRKQERKIRCMIVDYKRRAERRKDYYDRIKADPTQFLQVHGRPCKIYLDPAIAAAGDSSAVMMNWVGSPDVLIDRFDVRAHLDCIPEFKESDLDDQLTYDERYVNYERYRILVQNDFIGVSEEKFLYQLHLEEQFGASTRTGFVPPPIEGKKKVPGAAIGYNYNDDNAAGSSSTPSGSEPKAAQTPSSETKDIPLPESEPQDEEDEDDDSDLDFDVCVDVNQVTTQQAHELNNCSLTYGMEGNDFFSFLTKDKEEADNLRIAKEIEEEKSMYSGRKSRRERRLYREKQLAGRKISPPSYASRRSPTYNDYKQQFRSHSRSRSPSPDNTGQITYITSFGEEELAAADPTKSISQPDIDKKKIGSTRETSSSKAPQSRQKYMQSSSKSSRSPNSYHDRSKSPSYNQRSPNERSRRFSRSPDRYRSSSPRHYSSRSPANYRRRSRSPVHRDCYSSRDRYLSRDKYVPHSRHTSRDRYSSSRSRHSPPRSRYPPPSSRYSPPRDVHPLTSDYSHPRRSPSPPPAPVYTPKPRTSYNHSKPPSGFLKSDSVSSHPSQQTASVPRYYGRRGEKSSSSELSWSESEDTNNSATFSEKFSSSDIGNASGRTKSSGCSQAMKIGMRDRLKKKMQIMLNRQCMVSVACIFSVP